MRSASLPCALLPLLAAATASCQQESQSPTPKTFDGQTETPSDFARFVEVGDGGRFDTSVTTYERDGVEVVLYAAVHIADRACYEKLNERFRSCDVLLYELVGPADSRPVKGRKSEGFNPLGMMQQALKNGLQLSFQLDEIDYMPKNFVHADMTPQEFQSSMAERGESLLSIMYKMMTDGAKMQRKSPEALKGVAEVDLVEAFRSGDGRHRMRVSFAQQLEAMELMAAGGEGSTLLEGRNEKCLSVLRRELGKGHRRLGIYYGAAHLPHMEQRIVDDMGFRKIRHEWLEAWDCTKRADGDVAIDDVASRRASKLQLLRLAKTGKAWRAARGEDAAPPADLRELAALSSTDKVLVFVDPWGTAYRVERRPGKKLWQARSAGPDKQWGTKDDLKMREHSW